MNEYIKAVEKKLKKQGFSEEEIVEKIKNIINPKIMDEDVKVVDEVNMPVEVTPDADIEKIIDAEEVDTEEEEV